MEQSQKKQFPSFLEWNSLGGANSLSFIIILQLIVFWAVWRWMAIRVWTSSEEIWGTVSILAVIFFGFFWQKQSERLNRAAFIFPTVLTLVYIASFLFAPPLVRAILAMTALTFTFSRWRFGRTFHPGIYVLFLLSLPVMASMNFFLGFPLRIVIGEAVEFLLRLQGLDVWREGVCLHFGEKSVWIDAPCSGVKMLWFGMFLAAVLVCFYRLKNLKSLMAFALAFVSILLGNIFRASALFYTETEIIKAPAWMHEAVGVFAFAITGLGIVTIIKWLNSLAPLVSAPKPEIQTISPPPVSYAKFSAFFLILACAAAFVVKETSSISETSSFQGFPTQFEGTPLKQMDLTEREKYFLEEFPGRIGRFSDGRREIIIRWVTEATRKLHSSEDCFKAFGYKTKPLPVKIDEDGNHWSCFSANKNDDFLRVCQRISDNNGNEWTDVSAWYWSALNQTNGEWWAFTVAERE